MRKQDQLLSLIHSLSQGEKKFFVQRAKATEGGKSYLKLYELLLRKETYDADELCRLLNKNKASLANEKLYLQKQLVNALLQYNSEHPQIAALNRLAEATLLTERNLPQMATSAVKAGIKICHTSNAYPLAWHAHGLMLTLCGDPFMSFSEGAKEAEEQLRAMQKLADDMQLVTQFELLNQQVFRAYYTRRLDTTAGNRAETKRLLAHPLLNREYEQFQFLSYKYSLQALLYARLQDVQSGIRVNRQNVALFESLPQIDALGYWNALANLTQSIILSGEVKVYKEWMAKLETRYYHQLPVDARQVDEMLAKYYFIFNSGLFYNSLSVGEPQAVEIRNFAMQVIKQATAIKKRITPYHFASVIYKTSACCLAIGDANMAIDLLNMLLNEYSENVNPGSYKYCRVLFIMAHAQLGNAQLVTSLTQAFLNTKYKHAHEESEINFVRRVQLLANCTTSKSRKAWCTQMITHLESHAKANRQLVKTIPVVQWLSKVGR